MNVTRVIGFVLLLFCIQLYGREIHWHEGVIVLTDQEVLTGEISVQSSEVLLFRHEGSVSVYPSYKIQSIRYHDRDADVNRKFRVIKDNDLAFQHFSFYEIIIMGKLEVVRRQRGLSKEFPASD